MPTVTKTLNHSSASAFSIVAMARSAAATMSSQVAAFNQTVVLKTVTGPVSAKAWSVVSMARNIASSGTMATTFNFIAIVVVVIHKTLAMAASVAFAGISPRPIQWFTRSDGKPFQFYTRPDGLPFQWFSRGRDMRTIQQTIAMDAAFHQNVDKNTPTLRASSAFSIIAMNQNASATAEPATAFSIT